MYLFKGAVSITEVESTIIHALEMIATESEDWDVVVVIRGGGAVSDLSSFDKYNLANNCAQFPLPVFTGIGHERDICILDMVANRHFKTPTAVASFLIESMHEQMVRLCNLEESLYNSIDSIVENKKTALLHVIQRLDMVLHSYVPNRIVKLEHTFERVKSVVKHKLDVQNIRIESCAKRFYSTLERGMDHEYKRLQYLESVLRAYDPQQILNRGFSITFKDGKVVRNASQLHSGDILETHLKEGKVKSMVK